MLIPEVRLQHLRLEPLHAFGQYSIALEDKIALVVQTTLRFHIFRRHRAILPSMVLRPTFAGTRRRDILLETCGSTRAGGMFLSWVKLQVGLCVIDCENLRCKIQLPRDVCIAARSARSSRRRHCPAPYGITTCQPQHVNGEYVAGTTTEKQCGGGAIEERQSEIEDTTTDGIEVTLEISFKP